MLDINSDPVEWVVALDVGIDMVSIVGFGVEVGD
jgi:hypothetical protein